MTHEDSSAEGSSAWKGWVLGLVALPVLYMLSLPPVVLVVVYDRKTHSFRSAPGWLEWYTAPGDWVYDHVPLLKKPLGTYGNWYFKMYTGRSAP